MDKESVAYWQEQIRQTAVSFPYPPTPDVATTVRQRLAARRQRPAPARRLAWAAALALILLGGLLAVPQVRAAVFQAIRAGAITIFVGQPASTAVAPTATQPALSEAISAFAAPVTLAEAEERLTKPLRLPTFPDDLGMPDRVYAIGHNQPNVILLWLAPGGQEQIRLALYHIEADQFAQKQTARPVAEAHVHGRPAVWVAGPHLFSLDNGQAISRQFVAGNVLIWSENGVTYRLEGASSLAEAVRVAESLAEVVNSNQ